jgi:hypothetical protein
MQYTVMSTLACSFRGFLLRCERIDQRPGTLTDANLYLCMFSRRRIRLRHTQSNLLCAPFPSAENKRDKIDCIAT